MVFIKNITFTASVECIRNFLLEQAEPLFNSINRNSELSCLLLLLSVQKTLSSNRGFT